MYSKKEMCNNELAWEVKMAFINFITVICDFFSIHYIVAKDISSYMIISVVLRSALRSKQDFKIIAKFFVKSIFILIQSSLLRTHYNDLYDLNTC